MRLLAFLLSAAYVLGQTGWPDYAYDERGQRFSPLKQITPQNVSQLKLAWQYDIDPAVARANPAASIIAPTEAVPIVVDGVMYTPTMHRTVVALQPETGKEIWKYDIGNAGGPLRGVTFWPGDKSSPPTIFAGTTDGRLLAIHAKTGKLVPGFAREGVLDLRPGVADNFPRANYHMSSPGILYKNLIITGAQGQEDLPEGPAMDIRAWDVRTGKLAWTFHLFPHPGEFGADTWPKDRYINAGSPAAWGAATVDKQRGLVFLPVGQPSPQYYGGDRKGQNLFSSSIVALDANTGKLKWHFQLTHHDMWDYDAEAAPALLDVTRNGRKIPAVVAISKTSLMFLLDRRNGKPIFPVEERPVTQSDVPGESSWPTQPFPVAPPPLARLSMTDAEIFRGEPEHEKFCRDLVEKMGGSVNSKGPFTPYSDKEYRVIFPGQQGGANYGGVAIDPGLGYVVVNTRDLAGLGMLVKQTSGSPAYRRQTPLPGGQGSYYSRFWNPDTQMPCQQPPWASLTAVNANTGTIAWTVPLGINEAMEAKGVRNTGAFGQGGPITTAGGLVFIAGTVDRYFRAFDTRTGAELWRYKLDSEGHTNPMTFQGADGKQYVAIVSSGVSVFTLP